MIIQTCDCGPNARSRVLADIRACPLSGSASKMSPKTSFSTSSSNENRARKRGASRHSKFAYGIREGLPQGFAPHSPDEAADEDVQTSRVSLSPVSCQRGADLPGNSPHGRREGPPVMDRRSSEGGGLGLRTRGRKSGCVCVSLSHSFSIPSSL